MLDRVGIDDIKGKTVDKVIRSHDSSILLISFTDSTFLYIPATLDWADPILHLEDKFDLQYMGKQYTKEQLVSFFGQEVVDAMVAEQTKKKEEELNRDKESRRQRYEELRKEFENDAG